MKMEMKIPQLKTKIPMINGIFSHMEYDFKVMGLPELDIMLITTYGEKNVAPIVTSVMISDTVNDDEITRLSNIVLSLYRNKWDRFLGLYDLEYDAIHNYLDEYTENSQADMSRITSSTSTVINTGTDAASGTNTRTDDLSKSTTKSSENIISDSNDASKYAFNSEASVKTDESSSDSTSTLDETITVADTGTQTTAKDETRTLDLTKSSDGVTENSEELTRVRTFTHKGNIGNLTTQELIKQELRLWEWNFIETVLADVKDFLTIPFYLG